jgi:hypothetical protein
MKTKRFFTLGLLVVLLALGLVLAGCGDDDIVSGGGASLGCASLSAGTECSEHSSCSDRFLCKTGQGSDSNCTTGCSCQ